MYADFIEDRLAQNSEYIAMLKKGIEIFQPDWMGSNFREKIKYDNFSLIDSFFSNVKAEYNDTEKLFLYHSIYSQAGFEEALENLSFFITGLKIEIKKENVSYRPMINFNIDYTNQILNSDVQSLSDIPYNLLVRYINNGAYVNSSPISGASTSTGSDNKYIDFTVQYSNNSTHTVTATITSKTEDSTYNYILFDSNPYINNFLPENSYVTLRFTSGNLSNFTVPNEYNIITTSGVLWKLEKDDVASANLGRSLWRLLIDKNYTISQITYQDNPDLNLRLRWQYNNGSSDPSHLSIQPVNEETSFNSLCAHLSPDVKTGYVLDFNPYLIYNNTSSSSTLSEYPLVGGVGNKEKVYSYTIYVSAATELFYDTDLAKSQINELVRELLFYYRNETPKLDIKFLTFDNNVVNNRYNDLIISARKYYYLTL